VQVEDPHRSERNLAPGTVRVVRWILGAVALAVVLACIAVPAAAQYTRVATAAPDDDVAIAGNAVVVGATPKGGVTELALYGLDGVVRPIALPEPAGFVEELVASDSALAVIVLDVNRSGDAGYFGAVGGPLRALPRSLVDVAVTGDTVVSLHGRGSGRGWLELRAAATGVRRRVALARRDVALVTAAGRFAAYVSQFASPREITHVVDLRTGRERYRVRTPPDTAYGLARDGRLWFVAGERGVGRVWTATAPRPRARLVARMRVNPYDLAVTDDEIAVVRWSRARGSEIVLLRADGARRAVTPKLAGVEALAYDGATLGFATGACVFAGPVPPGPPAALHLAGCESMTWPPPRRAGSATTQREACARDRGPVDVRITPKRGPVGKRVRVGGRCFPRLWNSGYGIFLRRQFANPRECELIAGGAFRFRVNREGVGRGWFEVADDGACFQRRYRRRVTPGRYAVGFGSHASSIGHFRVTR
jgi:hypothetical protein